MIIPLGNKVRAEVIDSVIGQLSDGIWENSGAMNKYWMFAYVNGTDLEIDDEPFRDEAGWGRYGSTLRRTQNGFYGKSEAEIKNWFANKAKQVVKIWAEDYHKDPKAVWDRNNTDEVAYMGGHDVPDVTVADVYECYDFLKGRSGKKYATTPVEEPVEEVIDEPYEVIDDVEPQVSGGMNPSQQELEDFFTGASTRTRRKGYVRASDDILAYGKCIGYGVDYRNMHTGLHGILVFSDIDEAEQAYDDLKQAERANDDHEYNAILDNVFEFAVEDIDEINFRDFVELDGDKIYPVYSDEFIIIVNDFAVDLYL